MVYIINTLLEASAAFLHAPLVFGASLLIYLAYKGLTVTASAERLAYLERRFNEAKATLKDEDAKIHDLMRDKCQLVQRLEGLKKSHAKDLQETLDLKVRLEKAYLGSEAHARELRSQALLRVEGKGPFPDWSVMSYEDCYAAIEVSKMDLNIVIQGGRYEDDRVIITLLDADDVNSRHLDFQGMLEETESIVSKLREKIDYLKEQTTLEDIKEDWTHWEYRLRDAVSTALQDSDFIERCMDDLHSEMLEHLTNE